MRLKTRTASQLTMAETKDITAEIIRRTITEEIILTEEGNVDAV